MKDWTGKEIVYFSESNNSNECKIIKEVVFIPYNKIGKYEKQYGVGSFFDWKGNRK